MQQTAACEMELLREKREKRRKIVMINIYEVIETNEMIEHENLDVRTITLGISLLDCIDPDLGRLNREVISLIRVIPHGNFQTDGLAGQLRIIVFFAQMAQQHFLKMIVQQFPEKLSRMFIGQMSSVT